jgi:hypothetical protein
MKRRSLVSQPGASAGVKTVPASVPSHGTARGTAWHRRPKKGKSLLISMRYRCRCESFAKTAKLLKYQRYRRHRPIEKVHTLSRACALLPLHAEAGGKKSRHQLELYRVALMPHRQLNAVYGDHPQPMRRPVEAAASRSPLGPGSLGDWRPFQAGIADGIQSRFYCAPWPLQAKAGVELPVPFDGACRRLK